MRTSFDVLSFFFGALFRVTKKEGGGEKRLRWKWPSIDRRLFVFFFFLFYYFFLLLFGDGGGAGVATPTPTPRFASLDVVDVDVVVVVVLSASHHLATPPTSFFFIQFIFILFWPFFSPSKKFFSSLGLPSFTEFCDLIGLDFRRRHFPTLFFLFSFFLRDLLGSLFKNLIRFLLFSLNSFQGAAPVFYFFILLRNPTLFFY